MWPLGGALPVSLIVQSSSHLCGTDLIVRVFQVRT